jgi:hypothetical protein
MTETQESAIGTLELETPFAESFPAGEGAPAALGFMPWTETTSPFAETIGGELQTDSEHDEIVAEAFENIRDELFDEAVGELIAETAQAADSRVLGEQPMQLSAARFQLADAHLQPVGLAAEECVQRFADHVRNLDLQALAPEQLDEVLDRFDPGPGSVSVAGEEFIGGLIRKAKKVVKSVVNAAGKVAKSALSILGPILNKLKALIRPLLRRVLQIAINRLPAALHEPARTLARKLGLGEAGESAAAEEEFGTEGLAASPVTTLDPQTLAETFDAALAESVLGGEALEQGETFGHDHERGAEPEAGTQLEELADARTAFMSRLQQASDNEDLGPAVEQFIPAILPALRLGLRLVGRPKVVNFLAGFLAKMIGKWVGPTLSQPLSRAIVDIGLRIIGLEQGPAGELDTEAGPAALAATIEDTVRELSEQPEHVLEDEDLMQLAVSEAFERAVATNFPATLVRPNLRIAPTLGGTFVTRHARTPYAYKKFTRVPEIELTDAQAGALRSFHHVTLDAALRARGLSLPGKFRVHIFEAGVGTTLPRLAQLEKIGVGQRRSYGQLHPLSVANAAALLREPKLGVDVPPRFLESRHRIAVGQRFFYLEPIGQQTPIVSVGPSTAAGPGRAVGACDATHPSDGRVRINPKHRSARLALYFSEADAQRLASEITAKPGSTALLRALVRAVDTAVGIRGHGHHALEIPGELQLATDSEDERSRRGHHNLPLRAVHHMRLRRHIRASACTALSHWVRTRRQEFVRAAQHPACGVTVHVHVRGLPFGHTGAMGVAAAAAATTTVTVEPGRGRP